MGLSVDDERTELTITRVVPGLPADLAGLKTGDTILTLGNTPTQTLQDPMMRFAHYGFGLHE